MVWIKAKNGNVIDVADEDHAAQLVAEGHEGFESDPRGKTKAKAWKPADAVDEGSGTPEPEPVTK